MDWEKLLFFDPMPSMLPVYEKLKGELEAACPGLAVKVAKTQISFRCRYVFAAASLPYKRRKDWPKESLLVTFGLGYRKTSPRIAAAVEAYPGRWTHHVLATAPQDIDPELPGWLLEAYAFSLAK